MSQSSLEIKHNAHIYTYIRVIGYIVMCAIIIAVYGYWLTQDYSGTILLNRLTQTYGLCALSLIYIGVILRSISRYLRSDSLRFKLQFAAKTSLYLAIPTATAHLSIAFFGQLQGFAGLQFLSERYLLAIALGIGCWVGICIHLLSPRFSHRRIRQVLNLTLYVGIILLILHILILGTHYRQLQTPIAQITIWATILWLVSESIYLDRLIKSNFVRLPQLNYALMFTVILITWALPGVYNSNNDQPLSVHGHANSVANSKTKYNITYTTDTQFVPGKPVTYTFRIFDTSTGEMVRNFQRVNNQLMRISIWDHELREMQTYYPLFRGGVFTTEITLSDDTQYFVLCHFLPSGGAEQQILFSINPDSAPPHADTFTPNRELVAYSDDFQVTITDLPDAKSLATGSGLIKMRAWNWNAGTPVENLPYIGALSNLTLINTETRQVYIAHPTNLKLSSSYLRDNPDTKPKIVSHSHLGENTLKPYELGGPEIEFSLSDTLQPIRSGIYVAFASFNPGGELFQTKFIIQIK